MALKPCQNLKSQELVLKRTQGRFFKLPQNVKYAHRYP